MSKAGFWSSLLRKVWRSKAEGVEVRTETDGTRLWYRHGLLHREDGPAVERPNGQKEYWLGGYRWEEDGYLRTRPEYKKAEAAFFRRYEEEMRAKKQKPPDRNP
jgi:hypothetical protein